MSENYLIYILLGLLFAKEAFLPIFTQVIKKKFGLKNGNGSVNEIANQIADNHLHDKFDRLINSSEKIEQKLESIHNDVIYIKAKNNGK